MMPPGLPLPDMRPGTPMPAARSPASRIRPPRLPFDADDNTIRGVAYRGAEFCRDAAETSSDDQEALARSRAVCHSLGINPPRLVRPAGIQETKAAISRACCPMWWRKNLRRLVAQRVEAFEIQAGRVQRRSAIYCSNPGLDRHRASKQRNSELLAALQVVNEDGECFALDELAASSTSCPRLRRNELMARVKGLENIADKRGDVAVFVTWTLPSCFHAVQSKTGALNPAYGRISPKDASRYLAKLWAQARAALDRMECKPYGLRVAEPHADGTPHWHQLIFARPEELDRVCEILRRYALKDSPDEPGASAHRIRFEPIDKSRGSATGYIAKYISKNIDGYALDRTRTREVDGLIHDSANEPAAAAERIRCWASIWGIRQFQFFGTPPVTLWRELRRGEGKSSPVPAIERARAPADEGDYAGHVEAVGGVAVPRSEFALTTFRDAEPAGPNRYGELIKGRLRGVAAADGSGRLITRLHTWTILPPQRQGNFCPLDSCQ